MDPSLRDPVGLPAPRRPRFTLQLVVGLLVIALGVVFTLDNLGVMDADTVLQYWPAALVLIGALKLWQARESGGAVGGVALVLIGGWMLLEHLEYIRIRGADLWPLMFVMFGAYMVWKGMGGSRRVGSADTHAHVSALAIMSGVARRNDSPSFAGGNLTAIMGGCEIDLRQASISGGEAVLETFAFCGGIEIRVPEDWSVVSRVLPLMGGFEDKTRTSQASSTKRLVVRGFAIMGGVLIKN